MGLEVFDTGELVRVKGEFRNEQNDLYDPGVVRIKVQNSCGVLTTYVYGVDSALQRDGLGLFHIDVEATRAGTWRYRWESENGTGAEDGRFFVSN